MNQKNNHFSGLVTQLTINSLAFGQTALEVNLPAEQKSQVLLAQQLPPLQDPKNALLAAFEHPENSPVLSEIISEQDEVLIILPDKTRSCGANVFLPVLVQYLNDLGLRDAQIRFLVANGSHAGHSDTEITNLVGNTIRDRFDIAEHNCLDEEQLQYLGNTSAGIPVFVNKKLLSADRIIVAGTVVHHYFAGYGGGPKMIVPGCAGHKTITGNHALTISAEHGGIHRECRAGFFDNPVQRDIRDAISTIPVSFLLETVMNQSGEIAALFCGELYASHEQACAFIDASYRCSVTHKFDLVIASCGGFPKDINFIQAHKTLSNASRIVRDDGVIILIAQCAQGIGSETFMDWFDYQVPDDMIQALLNEYRLNGTTALSVLTQVKRTRILMVTDLATDLVTRMGMIPAAGIDEAILTAQQWLHNNFDICILPNGSITLPEVVSNDPM